MMTVVDASACACATSSGNENDHGPCRSAPALRLALRAWQEKRLSLDVVSRASSDDLFEEKNRFRVRGAQ